MPEDEHKRISSKGGKAKVPKGLAKLPPEDRIEIARKAAQARWENYRRNQGQELIKPK